MSSPGEAIFPPTDDDGSSSVLCSRPLAVLPPTNFGSLRRTTIVQLDCAKKLTKKIFVLLLHNFLMHYSNAEIIMNYLINYYRFLFEYANGISIL